MTQQDWQERYSQAGRVWSGKVNHWLVGVATGLPPGTALDLACGEGGDALWLAARGWDVTAVDFAAAALARGADAAAAQGLEVRWLPADIATWRPDRRYDLVSVQFLHTPDPAVRDAAIRTAWAATTGTLLVVSHDPRNAVEGTAGGPPAHVLYTAGDVLDILGIEPTDPRVVTSQARRRETPAGLWIDAVVVLRR